MKKILAIICTFLLVMCLICGCNSVSVDTETTSNSSMFIKVETAPNWMIVYHKDTKVMYAVSDGDYNHGTFTLLVDANGNPLIYGE